MKLILAICTTQTALCDYVLQQSERSAVATTHKSERRASWVGRINEREEFQGHWRGPPNCIYSANDTTRGALIY